MIAPPTSSSARRSLHRRMRAPCRALSAVRRVTSPRLPSSSHRRCCSLRHRAGSLRADTTTARTPPSRERVVDHDRAVGFVERASTFVCVSRVRPPPPHRERRCPSRAQPAAVLLASPRRLTESRHNNRENAAEPRASRRSRSCRRLRRACVDLRLRLARAAAAAAPRAPMPLSCSALCCSLRHRAGSTRAGTTTARAPPSRERIVDSDRTACVAERASIVVSASRTRPPPPRWARRCPSRAQPAAAPCVTAPAQQEPTRRP